MGFWSHKFQLVWNLCFMWITQQKEQETISSTSLSFLDLYLSTHLFRKFQRIHQALVIIAYRANLRVAERQEEETKPSKPNIDPILEKSTSYQITNLERTYFATSHSKKTWFTFSTTSPCDQTRNINTRDKRLYFARRWFNINLQQNINLNRIHYIPKHVICDMV